MDNPTQHKKRPSALQTSGLKFNERQQHAVDAACDGKNLFITGPGGTGKSATIDRIIRVLKQMGRQVAVCASTGIAAVNIGGCTIHSFLGTALSKDVTDLVSFMGNNGHVPTKHAERLNTVDTLVLDEVSMLTGDYLTMADLWIRMARIHRLAGTYKPFGGMQLIISGDFLQLPPVETRDDSFEHQYAFQSPVWSRLDAELVQLTHVFRQSDREFIHHLMRLRRGIVTPDTAAFFNSRVGVKLKDPTRLYAKNVMVDRVNREHFNRLPGKSRKYTALLTGSAQARERLLKNCLVGRTLALKLGAPVLFARNCYVQGNDYVNGERGRVVRMYHNTVEVEKENGDIVLVSKVTWELKNAGMKVVASMSQLPLKLAWAITIHKSQGMTLQTVECDISECFARGQAYVALSRACTTEGLSLTSPIDSTCITVDPKLVAFDESLGGGNR